MNLHDISLSLLPLPRTLGTISSKPKPTHSRPDREQWQRLEHALGHRVSRWEVEVRMTQRDELERDPVSGTRHDEGYRIEIGDAQALVEATSARGLRNALATLLQMEDELRHGQAGTDGGGEGMPFVVEDAPRFPVRALIEGYYGPPWDAAARRSMLKTMALAKLNAYFYAPKDDPYHRGRWNERYPAEELERLGELVEQAGALCIDVWYAIGPGLTMQYSSESDFTALLAKLHQVRSQGISRFALLFDDIPERLQHERDSAAFPDLATAHATVANRLYRALREEDPGLRLVVCPTAYWGTGNEPYISRLGSLLDPLVDVFWTGPEICSRELRLEDASLLARTLSRPPLYWDNYPVNDLEMARELHVGPYRGRDPHLYRAASGLVANGMQYPEATKLGLLTIADYLWNPEGYDPERSFRNALRLVAGRRDAAAFFAFADCNRYSALYQTDAPALAEALSRVEFARATRQPDEAVRILEHTIEGLREASRLFAGGMENAALQKEIAPWTERYERGIELLEALSRYIRDGESGKAELASAASVYRKTTTYVFADVLDAICEEASDAVH